MRNFLKALSFMFREENGQVSYRRIQSFGALVCAIIASFVALPYSGNGWVVFLPAGGLLAYSLAMPILTTIADVQAIIAAWRKSNKDE